MSFPLPAPIRDIAVQLGQKFPVLRQGNEDQRRILTRKIAEQTRFQFGPEWGTKRAAPGHDQSKDAIAQLRGGQIVCWDLFNGATREVHPDPINGEDISTQVFIEVLPVNHLESTVTAPVPSETLDFLLRQLLVRVGEVRAAVRDVETAFAAKKAPSYHGTISNRFLGSLSVTLTPKD